MSDIRTQVDSPSSPSPMESPAKREQRLLQEQRLLRVKPAAKYLGVCEDTLRNMVRRGEIRMIPGTSLRTPWLFDVRDLDQWIEKQKVGYPLLRRR